ncbi:sucrose-6-phosphate hydrolase [Spiroplasma helicoides]|uniref:beta-fructofuranosidase n=1 Tax=Spiroplasma helicoides TaxID=216938 RepID=A0A1B3SJB5_9MOLU|nr:GH32 C-terminal domain-containing protein [Spiroplasma helicoides]AOG60026.1 sucrose-6-phosphate hydrolase [Spiroplasma helicoides]
MNKIKEIEWKKCTEIDQKYYDESNKLVASDKYYRPTYHIASPNGLVNDPNGLLFKDGVHHIHYQWTPVEPYHGFKHWRYLTTKDFVNYEDQGVSVVPDHEKEQYGAFSGSAHDFGDTVKIYYTGNMEDGKGEMTEEVQLVADFENGKVINKRIAVPWDGSKFTPHARDPKIFRHENKDYMVFGVRMKDDDLGGLAVYEMIDYDKFEFKTVLRPSIKNNTYGYMWECPNLDKVGDKYLFFISAEGYFDKNDKYELNNSRNVVYTLLSKFDVNSKELHEDFAMRTVDFGHDFYAPQTYWAQDKLLWFGWFGGCDIQYPTDKYSWHSLITIPRELSVEGEWLVQKPYSDFSKNVLHNQKSLKTNSVDVHKAKHLKFKLDGNNGFKIMNKNNEFVEVEFTKDEIILDRSHQSEQVDYAFEAPRHAIRKVKDKEQWVEVFIDSSTIELFADDYKTIFTSRFFVKDFDKIVFGKELDLEVADIKPMKVSN